MFFVDTNPTPDGLPHRAHVNSNTHIYVYIQRLGQGVTNAYQEQSRRLYSINHACPAAEHAGSFAWLRACRLHLQQHRTSSCRAPQSRRPP